MRNAPATVWAWEVCPLPLPASPGRSSRGPQDAEFQASCALGLPSPPPPLPFVSDRGRGAGWCRGEQAVGLCLQRWGRGPKTAGTEGNGKLRGGLGFGAPAPASLLPRFVPDPVSAEVSGCLRLRALAWAGRGRSALKGPFPLRGDWTFSSFPTVLFCFREDAERLGRGLPAARGGASAARLPALRGPGSAAAPGPGRLPRPRGSVPRPFPSGSENPWVLPADRPVVLGAG